MQTGKKESLFFLNVISSKILYKEKKKIVLFLSCAEVRCTQILCYMG